MKVWLEVLQYVGFLNSWNIDNLFFNVKYLKPTLLQTGDYKKILLAILETNFLAVMIGEGVDASL